MMMATAAAAQVPAGMLNIRTSWRPDQSITLNLSAQHCEARIQDPARGIDLAYSSASQGVSRGDQGPVFQLTAVQPGDETREIDGLLCRRVSALHPSGAPVVAWVYQGVGTSGLAALLPAEVRYLQHYLTLPGVDGLVISMETAPGGQPVSIRTRYEAAE